MCLIVVMMIIGLLFFIKTNYYFFNIKNSSEILNLWNDFAATHPVMQNIQIVSQKANSTVNTKDLKSDTSSRRFVLCYSFWEQQTNGILNMWSFQTWAKKSGQLQAVEPFVTNSVLEFPRFIMYEHKFTNALHLSDYIDMDYWTSETAKFGIKPLVKWDTFVKHANKKVIFVILAYDARPGVYVNDQINNNQKCKSEQDHFGPLNYPLFELLHFEVIKIVCFAFSGSNFSLKRFNSYLISDNNATIWFSSWHGIDSGRIGIKGGTLSRLYGGTDKLLSMIRPSLRINKDSRNFIRNVLNVNSREYTMVVFRAAIKFHGMKVGGHTYRSIMNYYTKCLDKLKNVLDGMGSSRVLAIDIGKFGDYLQDIWFTKDEVENLVQQTVQTVYAGNKTVDDYYKDFINAANGIEDRGYIASMQKAIAENAKCLVMMGGGASFFQKHIILNYQKGSHNCIKYICY